MRDSPPSIAQPTCIPRCLPTLVGLPARAETSKFYGPFAAKLPDELTPILDAYSSALELSDTEGGTGYLFHPITGKTDRAMESSAWTTYVRKLFGRLAGTEIAPKTLRSICALAYSNTPAHEGSYILLCLPCTVITWLRESTDCPEVLKSAAHAMKHQQATQASANYDANADTKLVAAAYDFNLKYAAQFITPSLGGASVGDGLVGGSGSSSGEIPIGFERVEPQPEEYVFKLVPDKGKSSSRSRTFLCEIPWHPSFYPGCTLHFTVVPGRVDGMTRTVPKGSGIAGKNLRVVVSVEKQAVRGSSFALTDLLLMSGTASESESEAADEEVVEKAPSVADTEPVEIEEAEPDEEGGTDGHGFVAQDDQVTLMADETIEGGTPGTEAAPAASVDLGEPSNKRAKKATPAVPTAAPAPSITTELTLTEALSPFAGLKPVETMPEWLPALLEEERFEQLYGKHVAYRWEVSGFACGKLGPTSARDSNFSVMYENSWREHHTLEPSTYGTECYGAWVLLEGEVTVAHPLVGYAKSKYLVRCPDGDVWKRSAELIFHTNAQMESARSAAQTSKQAASQAAVESELRAPHALGDIVFVKTCAAGGEQSFRAKVIAIRAQFPPVKVKFISTLAGDTDKLALPVPLEAFVMADKITTTEPAMPTLARLRGKRAGPHS